MQFRIKSLMTGRTATDEIISILFDLDIKDNCLGLDYLVDLNIEESILFIKELREAAERLESFIKNLENIK